MTVAAAVAPVEAQVAVVAQGEVVVVAVVVELVGAAGVVLHMPSGIRTHRSLLRSIRKGNICRAKSMEECHNSRDRIQCRSQRGSVAVGTPGPQAALWPVP